MNPSCAIRLLIAACFAGMILIALDQTACIHISAIAQAQEQEQEQTQDQEDPEPTPQPQETPTPDVPLRRGSMIERCQAIQQDMEALEKKIAGLDEQLQTKAQAMNDAPEESRLDAAIEVINEMFWQQRVMRDQAMAMRERQLAHVCEHLMHSDPEHLQQTLAACPMVQSIQTLK